MVLCAFVVVVASIYANDSDARVSSDIWHEIIMEWMDFQSLVCISRANRKNNKLVTRSGILKKRKQERDKESIRSSIRELQLQNHSVVQSHKAFVEADADKIIQQYLLGFDGELEHMLIDIKHHYRMNQTEKSWTTSKIMHLKIKLADYRRQYGVIQPLQTITLNGSVHMFHEFISMHNKCQRLFSVIESIFGDHMHVEREMICGMKLMMQWIGFNEGYPGIISFDQRDVHYQDYNRLWIMIRADFIIWKRLIDFHTFDPDDTICEAERTLQQILRANENSTGLIDEFVDFLDDLYRKYLVKDIADYL